jgi:ribosomal-protein-alanine N-acetyltransferase
MSNRKSQSANVVVMGKTVYLRKPTGRDAEEFVALNRSSVELHRGLVSPTTSPAQFATFLKRSRQTDCACFLICRVMDNRIVGSINLSQIFLGGFRSAYLGYYICAPYAGQGYMSEGIRLILRYSFKRLKLHRLEANIQPGNLVSIALVKRMGFVREGYSRRYLKICGQWRDHERWAILSEDWKTHD